MKKRLLALVLLAALVLACTLGAQAAGSLCFVAVNDTIPLTLPGSEAPYYSGGVLYLPYTAFNANPGGAVVSYNVDQGTFVLFNRTSRLVYDLDAGTVADENGVETPVSVSYRGGMLYIPASAAEHFGYTVSLLTSTTGESIIRFTNGTQVYDDSLFVEKAANLIAYLNEQQDKEDPTTGSNTQTPGQGDAPPEQPETQPAEVYLALIDIRIEETVALLQEHNLQAAFFLTAQQLREQPHWRGKSTPQATPWHWRSPGRISPRRWARPTRHSFRRFSWRPCWRWCLRVPARVRPGGSSRIRGRCRRRSGAPARRPCSFCAGKTMHRR